MSPTTDLAASLIEAGTPGYASAASSRLLEAHPDVAEAHGNGAFRRWKEHYSLRLRELASALLVSEPQLFINDVAWSRESFDARKVPVDHLKASINVLGEVVGEELPEGSRDQPLAYLTEAYQHLEGGDWEASTVEAADPAHEKLALTYLEAALSGDRRRAVETVLSAVQEGMTPASVYQGVLATAQGKVGEMWHRWEVGVAQEHFVTATTKVAMALVANRFESKPARNKTVVVSLVPGNGHELASQALADFFELEGWRAIHLGGSLPAAEIALGVEAFEADLLALSVALSTQLRSAIEVIRKVRAQRPDTKILLGGRVFREMPDLWRKLGADGYGADYEQALELGERLTS